MRGQSCETDPYETWCYLQVDSVITELNCRPPGAVTELHGVGKPPYIWCHKFYKCGSSVRVKEKQENGHFPNTPCKQQRASCILKKKPKILVYMRSVGESFPLHSHLLVDSTLKTSLKLIKVKTSQWSGGWGNWPDNTGCHRLLVKIVI